MKNILLILLSGTFFVLLGVLGAALLAQEENDNSANYAQWDEQLEELGYRLFANSSINVIYGVNLNLEQAQKLRELAREVEEGGIRKPETKASFAPEVERVRQTFMEIEKKLFEQNEITDEDEKKLAEARKLESEFLRNGLTAPVFGEKYASCRRCHAEPEYVDGKITYDTDDRKWEAMGTRAKSEAVKKEMAIAHLGAVLKDTRGFVFMARMGKKVAGILNDNQREVVGEFSCCLTPPKSLSEPVRVGQANLSEWQVEMLEKARECPDAWWPAAKERTLDALEKGALIADPGMTDKRRQEERKRVGDILEKARSLSDVDFEIEKEALASQVKPKTAETPEHLKDFNGAFFLLMPGTVRVYDRLIEQLKESEKTLEGETEK